MRKTAQTYIFIWKKVQKNGTELYSDAKTLEKRHKCPDREYGNVVRISSAAAEQEEIVTKQSTIDIFHD